MGLKMIFNRKDKERRVTDLSVTYGGYRGRKILFNGSSLRFRNVVSPLMAQERYPAGFFEERVRLLNPGEARKLAHKLCQLDFSGWKSSDQLQFLRDGMINTHFWCRFSDGWEYRYDTDDEPDGEFRKMISLLVSYCDDKAVSATEKRVTQIRGRICPGCGQIIAADAAYCACCGHKQIPVQAEEIVSMDIDLDETVFTCAKCRAVVACDDAFCPTCGVKLK